MPAGPRPGVIKGQGLGWGTESWEPSGVADGLGHSHVTADNWVQISGEPASSCTLGVCAFLVPRQHQRQTGPEADLGVAPLGPWVFLCPQKGGQISPSQAFCFLSLASGTAGRGRFGEGVCVCSAVFLSFTPVPTLLFLSAVFGNANSERFSLCHGFSVFLDLMQASKEGATEISLLPGSQSLVNYFCR